MGASPEHRPSFLTCPWGVTFPLLFTSKFLCCECPSDVVGFREALWYGLCGGGHLRLRDIAALTNAEALACEDQMELAITYGCGADLLSDVLALVEDVGVLLLTGSVGMQTVRVAQVLQLGAVLFVRGKRPSEEVCAYARRACVPLFATELSMFEACGILYSEGVNVAQMATYPKTAPETRC